MNKYDDLDKLLKLKEDGILSEQEFEIEKKKVLGTEQNESKSQNDKIKDEVQNSNENIVKNYVEKINKEKTLSKKKNFKIFAITFTIVMIIILSIAGITSIVSNINENKKQEIEKSKEVVLPKVIGKTMAEAEEELSKLELKVERCSNTPSDLDGKNSDSIVQSITRDYSSIKEGETVKKGETIRIWGVSQKWKDEQQERKEKGYKYCPASNDTVIRCAQTLISNQLKAPSTAIWGKSEKVDEDNYGRCLVYVSVEAQNSFGGLVKSDYLVILQEVSTDGKFTYLPYGSTYTIETLGLSPYSYIEDYKNGNIYPVIQTFLDNNEWNTRPKDV